MRRPPRNSPVTSPNSKGGWRLALLSVQAAVGALLAKVGLGIGDRAKSLADYGVSLRDRARHELDAMGLGDGG